MSVRARPGVRREPTRKSCARARLKTSRLNRIVAARWGRWKPRGGPPDLAARSCEGLRGRPETVGLTSHGSASQKFGAPCLAGPHWAEGLWRTIICDSLVGPGSFGPCRRCNRFPRWIELRAACWPRHVLDRSPASPLYPKPSPTTRYAPTSPTSRGPLWSLGRRHCYPLASGPALVRVMATITRRSRRMASLYSSQSGCSPEIRR